MASPKRAHKPLWIKVIGAVLVAFVILVWIGNEIGSSANDGGSAGSSSAATSALNIASGNGLTVASTSAGPRASTSVSDTATTSVSTARNEEAVADAKSVQAALSELHSTTIGRMLDSATENNWAGVDQLAASISQSGQVTGDRDTARTENANGLAALRQGDVKDALGSFAQAIKADPSDVEAINNYGYALIKSGQNGAAVRALGQALMLVPTRTDAWTNLSEAIAGSDPDQAVSVLRLAYYFSSNRDHTVKYLQNVASYNEDKPYQHVAAVALNQLAAVPASNADVSQPLLNSASGLPSVAATTVNTQPGQVAVPASASSSPTMAMAQQSAQSGEKPTPDELYNSEAHSQCAGGLFGKDCRHRIREQICAGVAPGSPGATVCNKG